MPESSATRSIVATGAGPLERSQLAGRGRLLAPELAIIGEDVAEQGTLFDGIVQRLVRVRHLVKPSLRHPFLGRFAKTRSQCRHGEGLDVQRREREGRLAGKSDQVPVNE